MATDNMFLQIATEIGTLVDEKNKAYGDSFAKTGEFLRLLYPDGIPPEKYGDALCLVRMWDKMKRIATDKDALGESPYRDIAGYALLGIRMTESDCCSTDATMRNQTTKGKHVCGVSLSGRENSSNVRGTVVTTADGVSYFKADVSAGDGGIDKGI